MNRARQFQVVIVGGGIIGSTLAMVLSRAGIRIALLEREAPAQYSIGQQYGLRVSALSLASEYLLRNLQVWSKVEAVRVSPYKEMLVSDNSGSAVLHFDCADLLQQHLGHIVENDLLQSLLASSLLEQKKFELIRSTEIEAIDIGSSGVVIKFDGDRRIHAQLIVGADGAESIVRTMAGINVDNWPYFQCGVVSVVKTSNSHQETAWQRFLPGGPVAFLPLADGSCSIVWTVPEAQATRLLAMDESVFCQELSLASNHCLGDVISCGVRAAFPLQYLHADHYISHRLVLVGDAAHVVHPLAGQGVNMGLLDVAELGELLSLANAKGADLGAMKLLRRYERARRGENVIMGQAFDALNRLFATESRAISTTRNLGMDIVNRSRWLKQFFMRRATGLDQAVQRHYRADKTSLLSPPEFLASKNSDSLSGFR